MDRATTAYHGRVGSRHLALARQILSFVEREQTPDLFFSFFLFILNNNGKRKLRRS